MVRIGFFVLIFLCYAAFSSFGVISETQQSPNITISDPVSPIEEKVVLLPSPSKKEIFGHNLCMLISSYMRIYGYNPSSAEDLMIFTESIQEDWYLSLTYNKQYKYLKSKKKKLIFQTLPDSTFRFYYKRIQSSNLALEMSQDSPCNNLRTACVRFFYQDGLWVKNDSLDEEIKIKTTEIASTYRDSLIVSDDIHRTGSYYDKIILEYTPKGLINICNNEMIDISVSSFFREIYDYLHTVTEKYDYSRILVPTFTDN